MSYIDLINAFERWLETNYLPISSQLLWYKLIALFNKCGWSEWVTVDNYRLMSVMQIKNEKTFIKCRDYLIETGLFEYRKGKKGSPNQYKINTVKFTVQNTVQSTVYNTVQTTVNVTDINRLDKDIYIKLFYKYKEQIEKQEKFFDKMKIINQLKNDEEYIKLPLENQNEVFMQLMTINKKI